MKKSVAITELDHANTYQIVQYIKKIVFFKECSRDLIFYLFRIYKHSKSRLTCFELYMYIPLQEYLHVNLAIITLTFKLHKGN